ncbi:Tyrosyl-tRNA synthetase [Hordeum vulgare]|nr:Tyrosyl-tRNA synthetase [Hordeum vulgare]
MKLPFLMGLNNDITKAIFTNTYKSLDDLYFGALQAKQELKAKDTRPRGHFVTTKLDEHEHEDDGTMMKMTTEPLMEHALEASDKVESKDDASIFGGGCDDVPSSAFIHSDGDDMVEHEIFPSTTVVFGDDLKDFFHHIESESDFTTSPIYHEFPKFPCEERHNPHHLTEMIDSTIFDDNHCLASHKN